MTKRLAVALVLALSLLASAFATLPAAAAEPPVVLVWGGSYGFRHPSITQGELAFVQLGAQTGKFTAIVTENPADLNATLLEQVDAIAWISTTGKPPFTAAQRDAIIRFAACGGGTLAFHAAADSNYGWAEYAELLGAQFDSHPKNAGSGAARVNIEDPDHPITAGWGGATDFLLDDEYYRWRGAQGLPGISLPRDLPDTQVLLSLDESTVSENIQTGPTPYEHHQPIAWTKTFRGGGRVYYNNMGHSDGTWQEPEFRTSLVNGVEWVTEQRLDPACFTGDDPLPPAPTAPPADVETVGLPCEVPDVPARSGFTWQSSGAIKVLDESGDRMTLPSAGLPGGLGWGAQFYVLDLSQSAWPSADVVIDLGIPNPVDDYDLSVTTAWGWYGSQHPAGAAGERVVIHNAPHCAILQVYGDNLYGLSGEAPTLDVTVTQGAEEPGPGDSPIPELPEPPGVPPLPTTATGIVATGPQGSGWGFAPPVVALPAGSSLTFVNGDSTTHDVTSLQRDPVTRKPIFGSDYTNPGESAPVEGVEALPPGTYEFTCSLHGGMQGELRIL